MKRILVITLAVLLSTNVHARKMNPDLVKPPTAPIMMNPDEMPHKPMVKKPVKKHVVKHKRKAHANCDPKPEVVTCSMPKP